MNNVDMIDWNVQIQNVDTFNANVYSGDWADKKKEAFQPAIM